jgi:hypothetical protein
MVSTRTVLQLLVAVGAAIAAPAYLDTEDMLNARELSLDYPERRSVMLEHQEYSRGYEGDFVLSTRDLSLLGVRADDISHVLVVRAGSRSSSPKSSPKSSTADYEKQLAKHEKGLKSAKEKVKTAKEKLKADKSSKFWKDELKSAQDMVTYETEEIAEYKKLIGK